MTNTNIGSIQALKDCLTDYDKSLPVAIFDSRNGYMSVAFKKEQHQTEVGVFQWLTFYAHDTIPMYTIDTLLGYLEKLPPQATITKKTELDEYSPLFLSIDGMTDKGKTYQWLVISDCVEYEKFFEPQEISHTTQALDKLLKEMETNTSEQIERVHQWLCKQTNQELFKGILTDGKTIKGALEYCSKKAQEHAKNEQFAMIEDDTVYQWIMDYFITYELPKKQTTKKKPTKKAEKKPVNNVTKKETTTQKTEKGASEQQIDLFATI